MRSLIFKKASQYIPKQKLKGNSLQPKQKKQKVGKEKKKMAYLLHLLLNSCDRRGGSFKLRQHLRVVPQKFRETAGFSIEHEQQVHV